MRNDQRNEAGGRDGAEGASGADRLSAPPDDTRAPRLPFPVVGIGASAGGLEAYTEFLQAAPADAGMAYVLVQHLPPDRESLLVELLSRRTSMSVVEVTDGQSVVPNCVYVIRPGHTLTLKAGRLHLGQELAARGHGRPVDDFFRSLAEEQQQRAVAVVFSGMGSNGTAGAQAVKAVGGLVIAQEPDSAKFPAMPRSLIDSHLPDFILRPSEVPEALARYAGHPYAADDGGIATNPREEQSLADVLAVLRARTRHEFSGYRKATLFRRVRRRMGLGQFAVMADYVRALRQTPAEVAALADDLLIHVTGFFRDPEAWSMLLEKVIIPLIEARTNGAEVRCWVSACATGEEAYTLAMLLTEAAETRGKRFDVKVFATDMAERALGLARTGVFPNGIESEVTPERLMRFFDKDDCLYRVKKELRELVIFAPQNILHDPPFSRMDIATCRNLLIYLEPETQRRVLALLHFGLREGGTLMLGTSESVAAINGDFEAIDKKHRLFRRVGPTRPGTLDLPMLSSAVREARPAPLPVAGRPAPPAVAQLVSRALLDRHTPAAVAVDAVGTVVHVHGDTSRYLTLAPGGPTFDILALANDHIRGAVRSALHRATESYAPVTIRDGLIDTPEGRRRIEVSAAPLGPHGSASLYLVTFRDYPELPTPVLTTEGDPSAAEQLADQLQRTRNELQGTLEEMQSSNEELKTSHEEASSLNEELQSTNEELETSKEELQSLNEELVTVNAQLQAKMTELEATANDLGSLLTSTDIAVLFLDTKLRIRRFTPATKDLLDLIRSDVGRPLVDMRRKFADPELLADAQAVLDKLVPVERTIESESGRHYLRRVLPYRTQDNRIDGVVVAFVDVTERRKVDAALRTTEAKYQSLYESMDEAFAVVELIPDASGRWSDFLFVEVNPAFVRHTGMEDPVGRTATQLLGSPNARWAEVYGRVADTGEPVRFEEGEATIGRVLDLYVFRMGGPGSRRVAVLFTDITERKRAEERQTFRLRLSDVLRPLADPVAIEVEATRALGEHLGVGRVLYAEVEPDEDHILIHRDFTAAGMTSIVGRRQLSSFGPHWVEGYRAGRSLATSDTETISWAQSAAFEAVGVRACVGVPVSKDGKFIGLLIVHSAIPREWTPLEIALIEETAERTWSAVERAKAEKALRASETRLRAVAANLPNGAAFVVGPDLRYTLAEGRALAAVGMTSADFEGRTLREALSPDLAAEYEPNYLRALAGEPFRIEHAAHGRRYVTHGEPLRDGAGHVAAVLAVSYDITDLRQAEERLRLGLAAARMGVWTLEVGTGVHMRDANLNRLLGLEAIETTQPFEDFLAHMHPDDVPTIRAAFVASTREGRPLNVEFRIIRPDGTLRWLRDQGDVFGDGAAGARNMAGACIDVTDLKEAETALRDARDRLEERVVERTADLERAMDSLEAEMARRREVTRMLATVQEDERRRIARNLHDSIGQLTVGLSLALKAVETASDLPPPTLARLADTRRVVADLGREVHALAVRLRPTALDDIGLEPALGQLVSEWSARTGVRVDLHTAGLGPGRVSAEVETTVYRIVQEALSNVAKHAGASAVGVLVTRPDGSVSVVVEDNGTGFDPKTAPKGRLGILGMRERVELVGGELDVESKPGAGTTVLAHIPVKKTDGGDS